MVEAQATAKFVRTSAQKAGLVLALIRGRDVNGALATLMFSRKKVAKDIEKVLRSAMANARQAEGFGGDVDRLFVSECWADQGPGMKRVRPAPMGRAFRVVKRTAHLTVAVKERPAKKVGAAGSTPASKARAARVEKSRKAQAAKAAPESKRATE
jgi:large subunit ribosomal protein L22